MNAPSGPALKDAVRGHLPALDGLRGVAILLVLLHAFDVFGPAPAVAHLAGIVLDVGWIGVQLFFVLSGFLITGILLDTRSSTGWYRRFFVRRILRIFPLYFGVLAIAFLILPGLVALPPGHGLHQAWLWTFTENYTAPFNGGEKAFPHFWSLCVEEQFYLIWPLVIALFARSGTIVFSTALVFIAIAARVFVRQHFGDPTGIDATYVFTPCRMDALAMGAMAAALVRGERAARWIASRPPGLLAWSGAGIVIAGLLYGRLQRTGVQMQGAGYTVIALGFAVALIGVLRTDHLCARMLQQPALRRVGKYSYGMYVFHAPLHLFVGLPLLARIGQAPGPLQAAVYLLAATLATYAAGALSYHAYERHFLALKPVLAPAA
ncbi:MAG: acyltransferase [Pseudoxanthomonas sp.]